MRNPPMFCAHVALCYLIWVDKISTMLFTSWALQKFEDPGWEVKNPLKNWSCPDGGF
jgi:hypothetical protein